MEIDSLTHQILGSIAECLPLSIALIDEAKTNEEHSFHTRITFIGWAFTLNGWA